MAETKALGIALSIIGTVGLIGGWIYICWHDPEMAKHSESLWVLGTTLKTYWYFGVVALIGAIGIIVGD